MQFKNVNLYTYSTMPELTAEKLEEKRFKPCAPQALASFGFVNPDYSDKLILAVDEFLLICVQEEEKILPSSVVNKLVAEKVQEIEEAQDRKIFRKERDTIKDEIIFELAPKAFSKFRKTHAIIDTKNHLLMVDSSSFSKSEKLINLLREALGSLPVVMVQTAKPPVLAMTEWLNSQAVPDGFLTGSYCKLIEPSREGAIHVCRNEDLFGEQVATHLDAGMQVLELGVITNSLSFVVNENIQLKRLSFAIDIFAEADEIEDNTAYAKATLIIASRTIVSTLLSLVTDFGGTELEQAA